MINVDYDDDLYLLGADFWCKNECWDKQQGSSCACDYTRTNEGDCANKKKTNSNNENCDDQCALTDEDYDLYCSTKPRIITDAVVPSRPSSGWTVLRDGEASRDHILLDVYENKNFRFHTSESCKYVRVVAVPTKGTLKLEVATPLTWGNNSPFVYSNQRSSYSEISICPSDENFAPGTFYIRVSSTKGYTQFSVLVETIG